MVRHVAHMHVCMIHKDVVKNCKQCVLSATTLYSNAERESTKYCCNVPVESSLESAQTLLGFQNKQEERTVQGGASSQYHDASSETPEEREELGA